MSLRSLLKRLILENVNDCRTCQGQKPRLDEIDYENDYPDIARTSTCVDHEWVAEKMNEEMERLRKSHSENKAERKLAGKRGVSSPFLPIMSKKSRKDLTGDEGYVLGVNILKYIKVITELPKNIIDQNRKMEKSDIGGYQTTVNTGLPALISIAYDMKRQSFLVLNTCPGAGACKKLCYARGGQFGMNDNLIRKQIQRLNLLLNDPNKYQEMIMSELVYWANRVKKEGLKKGVDKKLVIRWNDSGDFFAEKYLKIAKKVTDDLIDMGFNVRSYAYTKIARFYNMGDDNFVMNFSKGAKESEQGQLDFEKVKYSDIVPIEMDIKGTDEIKPIFKDLFVKDKGNYVDDPKTGLPQFVPGGKEELKRRISKYFKVPLETLIYQYELPRQEQDNYRFNTIVLPKNDSDISAQRRDVRVTFLLFHG